MNTLTNHKGSNMNEFKKEKPLNTYSIVARDPETGDLGVAVQTHQVGVGRVVPWLLTGVGALATQSLANISFGPAGLAMLKEGVSAPQVIDGLVASDPKAAFRQVAIVDASGEVGAWTGSSCIPVAGHYAGDGYSVQANMMDHPTVIPAMREAYEKSPGRFADRLIASLEAAQEQGGDIRGMQSASIKIVRGDLPGSLRLRSWESRYDLRVDEHPAPVEELKRMTRLRTAQLISDLGDEAFGAGKPEEGHALWQEARSLAPELEEIGFWQAMTLADNFGDPAGAAEIFNQVFTQDPRRAQWMDLMTRLQTCGLLETDGISQWILEFLGGN
jgi:uncharacterized Ntn-hydrolase superfamily protein